MPDDTTIQFPCDDCGRLVTRPLFLGLRLGRYCRECKDARNMEREAEMARVHEASLAMNRERWLTDPKGGIPYKYRNLAWDHFRFDQGGESNRPRVAAFRKYAQDFPLDGFPRSTHSLVLASPNNGNGKTMLSCLILKDIINRFEDTARDRCPYQFWPVASVKFRLRAAERYGSKETQEDVVREFSTMWLLVLDDVGKEKLGGAEAEFAYEWYFSVLNARYNANLPVIITSNLDVAPWTAQGPSLVDLMGRATVSRLMEMTGGQSYLIEGADRR